MSSKELQLKLQTSPPSRIRLILLNMVSRLIRSMLHVPIGPVIPESFGEGRGGVGRGEMANQGFFSVPTSSEHCPTGQGKGASHQSSILQNRHNSVQVLRPPRSLTVAHNLKESTACLVDYGIKFIHQTFILPTLTSNSLSETTPTTVGLIASFGLTSQ
jgi:hypothetical protein